MSATPVVFTCRRQLLLFLDALGGSVKNLDIQEFLFR
jgi:hypothetical protein